jgi:hypothetical protein
MKKRHIHSLVKMSDVQQQQSHVEGHCTARTMLNTPLHEAWSRKLLPDLAARRRAGGHQMKISRGMLDLIMSAKKALAGRNYIGENENIWFAQHFVKGTI